jgi:hypothetical protein
VQRWLAAAEKARAQARWASERAARTKVESMAERFEAEAAIHLGSAACFEKTARSTFETHEVELEITRAVLRSLGPAAPPREDRRQETTRRLGSGG